MSKFTWLLIILVIGFIIYLACAMNTGHTGDQSINNFVKASFTLMTTLFIWTCVQILTKSFNMKYFSWVLSISGYIFALTVFCYFGIEQQKYFMNPLREFLKNKTREIQCGC